MRPPLIVLLCAATFANACSIGAALVLALIGAGLLHTERRRMPVLEPAPP